MSSIEFIDGVKPECVACMTEIHAELVAASEKLSLFYTIDFPHELSKDAAAWKKPLETAVNIARLNLNSAVTLAIDCAGPKDGVCQRTKR